MGLTTATASVTPAARPAGRYELMNSTISGEVLTQESGFAGDMAGLLIGQHVLVRLVGSEPDGHLGDDTTQHGTQTLVQTQGGLLPDDVDTGGHEATRLGL